MKMFKAIGVFLIIFSMYGCSYDPFKSWTLLICKESGTWNSRGCLTNKKVVDGFYTKNQCLLAGEAASNKEGFECCHGCTLNEYERYICDECCDAIGCW